MKSKNSRMGAGVGSFVRIAALIKANNPLVLFQKYSYFFIKNIKNYLKLK
jgi:ribosomal protein L16/L10AE